MKRILLLLLCLSFYLNVKAQQPAITSVAPTSGAVGTLVTITGTNLMSPTVISIGGVAAILISNTGTNLVAMVMPGAATGAVSVTTANGNATGTGNFTVTASQAPNRQQGTKLVGTGGSNDARQGIVSLSADGNTAIVGGYFDDGNAGAAWIYTRSGGIWGQQGGKLVGIGAVGKALQGFSVSLSADGNTAMVGGYADDRNAGAVWIYTRSGGIWAQQGGKLVGTGAVGKARQGSSVSLSADGNTAIVGGSFDNPAAGAVWIYTRSGGAWAQQGNKLVGTGGSSAAYQGCRVSLSADGNTVLFGGYNDNGGAGAAWVFTRSGGVWSQQGTKLLGTGAVGEANQGFSVSLSADGNTAMVGGFNDDGGAGAAWIYTRSGITWTQQGNKLVGTGGTGGALGKVYQGRSVSLSADGNTALLGGNYDTGDAGAAWVFTRSGGSWAQQGGKLVGTGAVGKAQQGGSVGLSADGNTAILGGLNDNSGAGAAWVFTNLSTNANLSALAISSGTIAPSFASATTAYTASVTNATENITVTPTVSEANATIKVNGTTVTSGAASGNIALSVGANTINTVVTAQDGTTTKTYTVTVTRAASNNADLSALAISSGTLSPAFTAANGTYTASVGNGTTAIKITPTVSEASATVTVNGTTVISGAASGNIALVVGSNTIDVKVTAQDGTTIKTYTVTVTRAKANQTITFNALTAATFGDADFSPGSTASSSLAVTYTSSNTNVATIVSGNIHIIGAGTSTITASQAGDATYNAATDVQQTLTVNKAATTLTLSSLTPTYNGSPKSATVTTDPVGLTGVNITYAGSTTAPTAAGTYAVVASLTNDNYTATNATGNLVIGKASATLTLSDLTPTYDGSAKSATVTTDPVGLTGVSITYGGSATAPTAAGTYAVVASLTNDNYTATNATGSLVIGKATTTLTLSNLTQTYNGSAKSATVTTAPAGLSGVSITYAGSATAPTAAGTYAVIASLTNDNYTATNATGSLVIGKASATLTLSNLTQTYNGSAKSATVTTAPAGLSGVSITYAGSAIAPTAAGTYAVIASLTNDNYTATNATGSLVIGKATTTLTLINLTQTYNGSAKSATVTTDPVGLTGVDITYAGSATAPTAAGTYAVIASLTNDNYTATNATGSLVIGKGTATLTLSNLTQTYNGSAKSATVITDPVGLTGVYITYAGSTTAPTVAGTYAVIASLTNDNYTATNATGSLVIGKADQTITFPAFVTKTTASPDFEPGATTDSGLALTYISSNPLVATVAQDINDGNKWKIHILTEGTTDIVASQAGDNDYNAASALRELVVGTVLPASLVDYQVKIQNNSEVLLSWATVSEANNAGFEVWKSTDGKTFTKLAFVKGAGNSNAVNAYSYVDLSPSNGTNYYKLVQVDNNGSKSDKGVKSVNFSFGENNQISVYPNPTADAVNVTFEAGIYHSVKIIDLSGKVLVKKNVIATETKAKFSLSAFPDAVYILQLTWKNGTISKQIVKK